MNPSQILFLDFLIDSKALKLNVDYKLKNGRFSPYFINIGELNSGNALNKLGDAYASKIEELEINFNILFGPAYKGIQIVVATSISLAARGKNYSVAFNRKEPKSHGEGSGNSKQSLIVGRVLQDNDKILLLDDVLTTAETKYEFISFLTSLAKNVEIVAIVIGVDRQEVGIDGSDAIEELKKTTGIAVIPVITAVDLLTYLKSRSDVPQTTTKRIETYMHVYGNSSVHEHIGKIPEQTIIANNNTIIPACDVPSIQEFEHLVRETADLNAIGGYKLGFELALRYGLPDLVACARKYTDKPLIYDHQKAATDIPEKGKDFARVCKESGIDTVILFPQAGPETERAWIYYAVEQGLHVIVGGIMSHKAYTTNEGGFIDEESAYRIYKIAASAGITNYVVPATKIEVIKKVNNIIEQEGITPTFYSPGFFTQGGNVEQVKSVLGKRIHVIVGREINNATDKRQAVLDIAKRIA